MVQIRRVGTVVISVDAPSPAGRDGRLSAAVGELMGLLGEQQVPATWGFSADELATAARLFVGKKTPHEWALSADGTWVGAHVSPGVFARELRRRMEVANLAGIEVKTLLITGTSLGPHANHAAKEGLVCVRSDGIHAGVRSLRYGLWEVPTTVRIPDDRRSAVFGRARKIIKAIEAAVVDRGVCQIAINVEGWRSSSGGERMLRQILGHIRELNSHDEIRVMTLRSLAAVLTQPQPVSVPARSILRAA